MTFARFMPAGGLAAALAALLAAGCGGDIECKTELTTGAASYHGAARGKVEDEALRRESARDACRQKCAAESSAILDACTAACSTDVVSKKIGARTTCGRK